MKLSTLSSAQKILVYGFGIEGKSTLQFIKSYFPEATVHVYDDNLAINMPDFKKYPLEKYDVLIVSPGIDRERFSADVQIKITSQAEIFLENLPEEKRKKVIGISGTKGKSTTTKFCTEALKKAGKKAVSAGNYGVPLLDIFTDFIKNRWEYVVAELSSYQLEPLKKSPGISLFLNIYPEHLDRHGDYESYIEAKSNLWRHQSPQDILITPRKIKPLVEKQKKINVFVSDAVSEEIFPQKSIFRASHFRENFGTVALLFHLLDIEEKALEKTASKFKGLPHRLEFIAQKKGLYFYNDSISTNPHSTYSALQFLKDRVGVLIVGGKDRGIDYTMLSHAVQKFCPNVWVFILESETKNKIVDSFKKNKITRYKIIKDIPQAVTHSLALDIKGKICLLSPAASSFDKFQSYIERGNLFKKCVLEQS